MKEIKFRLVKDSKIVGYEFHELGNFGNVSTAYRMSFIKTDVELLGRIVHDHKDQFTGSEDKNGVEIYEGDILLFEFFKRNYKVEWINVRLGYLAVNGAWDIEPTAFKKTKIIGNIHENPELSEAK